MHEAIHNLARARNTLPKSTFGAGKPAQPPFHRSQEPPSQSAPAQPFIGAMDPPKGSAAKDAPFYAAKVRCFRDAIEGPHAQSLAASHIVSSLPLVL